MQASPIQTSFNAGEIDPKLVGRVDYDRMQSALQVCLNSIPRVTGPVTRRTGSYFCDEVKDSRKRTRIYKFKYSTIQAYVLEFGDQYLRVKKNHAPIYDLTVSITNAAASDPVVLTYSGDDPTDGDHVDIAGVVGMTELNGRRFMVMAVNSAAKTFQLWTVDGVAVNGTGFSAYVSGGDAQRVYTLATPYLEADLFRLKFTQSADTLYIWHPDYQERTLTRTADAVWTLATTTLIDGPYLPVNTTSTTLTPSAATGSSITITASSTTGINDGQGFLPTDVGRLIRMKQGSTWGYVLITGYTSATVVTASVINTLTSTAAKLNWRLGLYSDTTGYPACGGFHGDRLYRGGVPYMPDRIDGSKVSDYLNMAETDTDGTVTDEHAVSFRLNSDDVQTIRWMRSLASGLSIGTFEGEWLLSPSINQEAITPTNRQARQSSAWGSADAMAVRVGNSIVFIEAGARRVREMNYLYYDNELQSPDMTILAEHITRGRFDPGRSSAERAVPEESGLLEIDFVKKPIPSLWAVRNDGVLVGATYHKDEKVLGWHRHILGGWSNADRTAHAIVESLTVIPASDGSIDELWLVVRRHLNGRTVRYIEYLLGPWEQGTPLHDAHFVDCGMIYDGTPTTTITGLFHVAGETIQVLVDGATHPDVVVSATGAITLTRPASVVHAGYSYRSDGKTLRANVGAMDGTAQGKIQRSHKVTFRFHETLGAEVGPSFDALTPITFRSAADPMGSPPPLFTGDKTVTWPGNYTTEDYKCWRFQSPLPGEILAIMPKLHTQDGL